MSYQTISLAQSHGFAARRLAEHPHVAVLTAPSGVSREEYHNVLAQLATAGVTRVVVDVSGVMSERKLDFAYMKPSAKDVPGLDLTYIAGITKEDIHAGANSEHAARSMETSKGFKRTVDDAVAECLR